ncbi:MAG: pyrimidine 5'-nucleotidase [Betaproteobacteria bacterium]|nr:pyrimidine 5'-nucleotidase [Betaproteobacteria bacterium]
MKSRVWVFDLDNTLHDASPHIFPHMNRSMTAYLQKYLGLDQEAAARLRMQYWRRYGATLLGLMRHHDVDPRHFLWETHQFPELERMVRREPWLKPVLRRLPGRKFVFSNSPLHYSRAVLRVLGIAELFDGLFSIEHTRYRPKPDACGFWRLLRRHRLHPGDCVMVEDSLENLRTAKRLGMKTVWVTRSARSPAFVDLSVGSLAELPRLLHRL